MDRLIHVNPELFFKQVGCDLLVEINKVCESGNIVSNALCFCLDINYLNLKKLSSSVNVLLLLSDNVELDPKDYPDNQIIFCRNPRRKYIEILRLSSNYIDSPYYDQNFVETSSEMTYVHNTSVIHKTAVLHPFVYVGPNCSVGPNVKLLPGVKLIENVVIDDGVIVGANTVIGQWGFSIERDNQKIRESLPLIGPAMKMPHFGGVHIARNCNIGACTTIASGSIRPTVIGEGVQIDDQVFIAHNCEIGRDVAIIAQAEISGSVVVGEGSWIGPGVTIIQKVNIGSFSIIGIGANVTHHVDDDSLYVGNPARKLRSLREDA